MAVNDSFLAMNGFMCVGFAGAHPDIGMSFVPVFLRNYCLMAKT